MTENQGKLWQKIKRFELDDPQSALTFTDRLARENGWSLEYAMETVLEYKKFMFLLCVADHPLTPSDQVDQVWHLHLLYTESYWVSFCEHTIGRKIHHGPTQGGINENAKYTDWYEKTKEFYAQVFSETPPNHIWLPSTVRFTEIHFQRVNMHTHWTFKKPKFFKK
jgi:hypothetical protein